MRRQQHRNARLPGDAFDQVEQTRRVRGVESVLDLLDREHDSGGGCIERGTGRTGSTDIKRCRRRHQGRGHRAETQDPVTHEPGRSASSPPLVKSKHDPTLIGPGKIEGFHIAIRDDAHHVLQILEPPRIRSPKMKNGGGQILAVPSQPVLPRRDIIPHQLRRGIQIEGVGQCVRHCHRTSDQLPNGCRLDNQCGPDLPQNTPVVAHRNQPAGSVHAASVGDLQALPTRTLDLEPDLLLPGAGLHEPLV